MNNEIEELKERIRELEHLTEMMPLDVGASVEGGTVTDLYEIMEDIVYTDFTATLLNTPDTNIPSPVDGIGRVKNLRDASIVYVLYDNTAFFRPVPMPDELLTLKAGTRIMLTYDRTVSVTAGGEDDVALMHLARTQAAPASPSVVYEIYEGQEIPPLNTQGIAYDETISSSRPPADVNVSKTHWIGYGRAFNVATGEFVMIINNGDCSDSILRLVLMKGDRGVLGNVFSAVGASYYEFLSL